MLEDVCQVQKIIGCSVEGDAREGPCWNVSARSPFGERIDWDVIHYNEGLHSLWPRVNTTADLKVWASHLTQFTRMMQNTHPGATLICTIASPNQLGKSCIALPELCESPLIARKVLEIIMVPPSFCSLLHAHTHTHTHTRWLTRRYFCVHACGGCARVCDV